MLFQYINFDHLYIFQLWERVPDVTPQITHMQCLWIRLHEVFPLNGKSENYRTDQVNMPMLY